MSYILPVWLCVLQPQTRFRGSKSIPVEATFPSFHVFSNRLISKEPCVMYDSQFSPLKKTILKFAANKYRLEIRVLGKKEYWAFGVLRAHFFIFIYLLREILLHTTCIYTFTPTNHRKLLLYPSYDLTSILPRH